MYPRITRELVAGSLGSAVHTLGNAEINGCDQYLLFLLGATMILLAPSAKK